jgi:hypothetical protein
MFCPSTLSKSIFEIVSLSSSNSKSKNFSFPFWIESGILCIASIISCTYFTPVVSSGKNNKLRLKIKVSCNTLYPISRSFSSFSRYFLLINFLNLNHRYSLCLPSFVFHRNIHDCHNCYTCENNTDTKDEYRHTISPFLSHHWES